MAKIRFPEKENNIRIDQLQGPNGEGSVFKSKVTVFSARVFSIVKLLLGLCLLAFVYSCSVSFFKEFAVIGQSIRNSFWAGVISFVIVHLFIYESGAIYRRGQRLLEVLFKFFTPLVRVAPYVLPIYTIIIFLFYLLASLVAKPEAHIHSFVFLFGFSAAFHIVFSAKSLRTRQEDFLKANYIFGFSFVYVINIVLVALFFNFIFEKFSLVNFFNNSFQIAKNIFAAVFKQLFL